MLELLDARCLERPDLAPLRVDAAEDVFDRSVLAAGVDGLQHDQQALPVLGVEPFLPRSDPSSFRPEQLDDVGLRCEARVLSGVDPGEHDRLAGLDAMRGDRSRHPLDPTGAVVELSSGGVDEHALPSIWAQGPRRAAPPSPTAPGQPATARWHGRGERAGRSTRSARYSTTSAAGTRNGPHSNAGR